MTFPIIQQSSLPPNTIVPVGDYEFIPYLNRLYEDIAFAVNGKVSGFFATAITSTATNIPNCPNFGSFLICVSGAQSGLPTLIVAACKADLQSSGVVATLQSQAGTVAPWVAATLSITSTATNFQIAHSVAGQSGNFNIQIIGTA